MNNEALLELIAFTLFLTIWELDNVELTEAKVDYFRKKWEQEWLSSLNKPHNGDCVKIPAPCTRCHTEEILAEAHQILKGYGANKNNDYRRS